MADVYDPSELVPLPAPIPSGVPDTGPQIYDASEVTNYQPTNPATGEPRPSFADGTSPESPINASPVSLEDRFKLALGNDKGRVSYLKQKFDDAKLNSAGELVINNKGAWHAVDPKGLGDGDAWEKSRQLIGDVADVSPTIATVGAMFAADAATGGVGIAATGAIGGMGEAARTSMGRVVGTYDASPGQQMADVGVETLLNMGGAAIGAGVRPTAKVLGNALGKAGDVLSQAPQASKNLLSTVIAGSIKKEPGPVLNYLNNPAPVKEAMKRFGAGAVGSQEIIERATKDQINAVKDIAEQAQPVMDKMYGKMKSDLLDSVPDDYRSVVQPTVASVYNMANKAGIGEFIYAGKPVVQQDLTKGPVGLLTAATKEMPLTADAIMASVEKTGKLPAGVQFRIRPQAELLKTQQQTGMITEIANDKDAHQMVSDLLGKMKNFERLPAPANSKAAASQVLDFQKTVGDLTWKARSQAKENSIPFVSKAMADVNNLIKSNVAKSFEQEGLPNKFVDLNKTYSENSDELLGVMRAVRSAERVGDSAYESLVKQITRPGNVTKKEGLGKVVALANEMGNPAPAAAFQRIANNESVKTFAPWTSGEAKNSVDMLLQPLRSPRATGYGLGVGTSVASGASKVTATTTKAAMDGMMMLRSQTPDTLKALVSDPKNLQKYFATVLSAQPMQDAITSHLMNGAMSVSQPQQMTAPQDGQ